ARDQLLEGPGLVIPDAEHEADVRVAQGQLRAGFAGRCHGCLGSALSRVGGGGAVGQPGRAVPSPQMKHLPTRNVPAGGPLPPPPPLGGGGGPRLPPPPSPSGEGGGGVLVPRLPPPPPAAVGRRRRRCPRPCACAP